MELKDYITFLSAVAPVFCAVALGIWFRKKNWLSEAADGSLLRLTVNALLPALILDSILENSALKNPGNIIIAPLLGLLTVSIGMGLALVLAKYAGGFLGLATNNARWTFALCVGVFSYSYVPLSLAKTLFGSDTTGVLLAHNLGVEISLWTLGLILLGVNGVLKGWKQLLNPPLIAVVVGLTVNYVKVYQNFYEPGWVWLDYFIPRWFLWSIGLLGQCAVPLGLILTGATLADHLHDFRAASGGRVMLTACALRLLILPFTFLLIARFVPLSNELKQVLVLQSAMPASVVPVIIMVKHYGGEMTTALRVVVATSVVSLFTMPLWILFGLKFAFVKM